MFVGKTDFVRDGLDRKSSMVQSEGICSVLVGEVARKAFFCLVGGEKWKLDTAGMKSLPSLFPLPQLGGERGEYNLMSV